jgi:hypothetical protein
VAEQASAEIARFHDQHAQPNGAISAATASDRPSRANFAAQYAETLGPAMRPPCELICTIMPEPCARIRGSTARVSAAGPKNIVFIARSQVVEGRLLERPDESDQWSHLRPATLLTVIPRGPSCWASVLLKTLMAPLDIA